MSDDVSDLPARHARLVAAARAVLGEDEEHGITLWELGVLSARTLDNASSEAFYRRKAKIERELRAALEEER